MNQEAVALIKRQGFFRHSVDLPTSIQDLVLARNWSELDRAIGAEVQSGGVLFRTLRKFAEFSQIEFIISIRSSLVEPDEDGIWHDDGSRVLAFSLSLTLDPASISGGLLEIRHRGKLNSESAIQLPTPEFGTMIIFATGYQGFEHKINAVREGERIIIAGWCT